MLQCHKGLLGAAAKGRRHGPFDKTRTSPSESTRVGEDVKVTNETPILLCKPLNARELRCCSISVMDLERGDGTVEIAASRSTTAQVIKNYTYRACQKLGADNRTHLIAVAFRAGIIK
jgi:DNA-binding CsgD family transcriptional regulator